MAKKNEELIAETAAVLLEQIKEMGSAARHVSQIKELAEAFALVAEHDAPKPRSGVGIA